MAKLTDEQQRALRLLARSPNGEKLVTAGLAEAWSEDVVSRHPGRSLPSRRKRLKVGWMGITEEGRKAIVK